MPTYDDPQDIVDDLRKHVAALGGRRIAAIIVGVLLLIFLWSTWFTVQPEETGVVQRFGAVDRTVGPGLHFKFPDGIERVRLVPTARVLKEEFGFGTASMGAGGRTQYAAVIDVQWIVQYRIEDPVRYLFRVRQAPQTIRDIAEAVMRRVVGNRLGSDVLTVGRVAVSTEVKEEMQKILSAYETGVRLVTVELQDVTPPDPVKPAFNEVNEARQDRERTINQAQERANRFAAILGEYQRAPEVTRRRLYLEAMGTILPEAKALYIVDSEQKALLPWLRLESGQIPAAASGQAEGVKGGKQP
jgi:membrane protease subunit HflK